MPKCRALRPTFPWLAALPLLFGVGASQAQSSAPSVAASALPADPGWQSCQQLGDNQEARLACFDRWAQAQRPVQPPQPGLGVPPAFTILVSSASALAATPTPASQLHVTPLADTAASIAPRVVVVNTDGCKDAQYSQMSRFWELEEGSSCGTFGFRGYRPITVSVSAAASKPGVPTSPSADHTGTAIAYQANELRIGMSVRTKLAQGLLTQGNSNAKDSVWFGYTQQSTWQLFNGAISRPFRSTDHEPEVMYVVPLDFALPGGWRWRYAGVGLVHQSNGQSLPYSRSWNRAYLMGGMELDNRLRLTARVWQHLKETASNDDNPDITSHLGRAEFSGLWDYDKHNTVGLTLRSTLHRASRGAVKLEWLKAIGDPSTSKLRLHTQLFSGYGDTLVDYNRRRTVFSVGLSLVDF